METQKNKTIRTTVLKYRSNNICSHSINPGNIIYGQVIDQKEFDNNGCYVMKNCDVIFNKDNNPLVISIDY